MNVRNVIKPTQVYLSLLALILSAAVARADITSALEVRYRLDGSSAADSSGNGNTGTLTNGAAFTASGRFGGGVDLHPGTNQYISCPDIPATSGATELTIAFWLYVDTLENYSQLCTKYQHFNNLVSVQLSTTGVGGYDDIEVNIHTAGTYGLVVTTGDVISANKWLHVTVVYDNSQSGDTNKVKVYINGQLVDRTSVAALPSSLHSGSEPWRIGYRADSPDSLGLDGKVDEFYMYSRALSASDVQELYNWTSVGIFSSDFNGLTSKLENDIADLLAGSDEMTICAWLYPTAQGETANNVGGVAVALDETGRNVLLGHATSGQNLMFVYKHDVADNTATFAVPHNAWTPVAISHKYITAAVPTIRVNFQNVAPTMTGPGGIPLSTISGYCIGNVAAQSNTWAGRIAHVQFFNRRLSAAEMDAALREPGSITHNLRLWLPMTNETDTNDRSGNGFDGTPTHVTTATKGPIYDSLFQFGVVNETVGQIVIPSNGSEPAIGVRGLGTRSKLIASGSLNNGARFITTEGWNTVNTVFEPIVRDLYLFGNQNIPTHPYGNEDELDIDDPVCHAIAIDGDAATVIGCKVYDFRGDAIWVKNNTEEHSRLPRMPRVINNTISHCWTGIRSQAVDTQISGNRIANVRDIGIRCLSGSEQLTGNHSFGAQVAISAEGGPVQSVNDRFADAPVGFQLLNSASNSIIKGGIAMHCWKQSILSKAQRVQISSCFIDVPNTDDAHRGDPLATYTTGTVDSTGTTVTLDGGTWPTWAAGATIVSDGQTRTIVTRISDSQVTVTMAPSPAWNDDMHSTTRSRIVGVWLHFQGNQNVVNDCYVRLGDFTFGSSANTRGSVGVFVEHHNTRVEGLRVQGSMQAGEVGCLVAAGRIPIYIEIDSTGGPAGNPVGENDGFRDSGDAVLEFADHTSEGLCYVTYSPNEIPVRIPEGWGSDGSLRIFTRVNGGVVTTGTWTELTPGQAYPQ